MPSNFTFEDLDAFGERLHINTAIDLVVNFYVIYLILTKSTKPMENYKYYILFTVCSGLLMDFHLSFVFGMFITLPLPGNCAAGISKHFSWFWGSNVQYWIMHVNLSLVGLSIIVSLLYRYYSLGTSSKFKFFRSRKAFLVYLIIGILYPIPLILINSIMYSVSTKEMMVELAQKIAPEFSFIYTFANCSCYVNAEIAFLYLTVTLLFILFASGLILGYAIKTARLLNSMKSSLQPTTYAMQRQFLYCLYFQCMVPIVFIFVPTTMLIICSLYKSSNMNFWSQMATQIFALHSSANGILVIFSIKPYRNAFKNIFRKKEIKTNIRYKKSITELTPGVTKVVS